MMPGHKIIDGNTSVGWQRGIDVSGHMSAANVAIVQNTFSAGTSANGYLNSTVNVSAVNNVPWSIATASYTPYPFGVVITQNKLDNVYRGIAVSGIAGFRTRIEENNITLVKDASLPIWNGPQHGIHVSNHISANNFYYQAVVTSNTLTGVSTSTPNSKESLVYIGNNLSLYSPSLTCNILNGGNNGFEINSINSPSNVIGAIWAGNIMYPMVKGLFLRNNGIMGTQGGSTTANANEWRNTWTNYHTDVDGTSNASLSVLYVKGGAPYEPTLNFGPTSQYFGNTGNIQISTGGDYNCMGIPNNIITPYPESEEFYNEGMEYIANTAMYRFLHFNDSVKEHTPGLSAFYDNLSGSSIEKFIQIEEYLYEGYISEARIINTDIEADLNVETNYQTYYTLYANYLENIIDGDPFSSEDSLLLFELSMLCPGRDGACVYQARSLYNFIYRISIDQTDCEEEESSERKANSNLEEETIDKTTSINQFKFYPNPASDEVTIEIAGNGDMITIEISDLSGRSLQRNVLQISNNKANFKIDLVNGAYIITVTKSNNEKANRKLLLSK